MKVLITAPSLDETRNVSGISTVVRQIIEYSAGEFDHFEAGRQDGSENTLLWLARQIILPIRFLRRIRSFSPDVVHINTAMTTLAVCRDAVLVWVSSAAGRDTVLSIHGGEYLTTPFTGRIIERIAWKMLRRAGHVVVLSENEHALLSKRWPDVQFDVLPNSITVGSVAVRNNENNPPVMIFLGRMHESKGLSIIIEACRILKTQGCEFEFRAYGEGPMRESFVDEMTNILSHSFQYGGVVASSDKWNVLAAADFFVLPSAFEGLSMALLEAMAAGCVVVASNIASISTVIRNGENGYLFEPKSSGELADVLRQLLAAPELAKIRENAAATIRDNYGIEGYVEKLEEIYTSALNSRK